MAHVFPAWDMSAGDPTPGIAMASAQGLRLQKVVQAGSLVLEHPQRPGRERR